MDSRSPTHGMFGRNGLLAKLEAANLNNTADSNDNDSVDKLHGDFQNQGEKNAKGSELGGAEERKPAERQSRTQLQESEPGKDGDSVKMNSLQGDQLKPGFVPLQSLQAEEAIFFIEKIRKNIFSQLNLTDLKSCRLVSRAWQMYATNDTLMNDNKNHIHIRISQCKKHKMYQAQRGLLQELTELMDITGENLFPCNSFTISIKINREKKPDLDNFLDNHGFRIKNLIIEYTFENTASNDVLEKVLYHFIKRLLVQQAPNLETLTINAYATQSIQATEAEVKEEFYRSSKLEKKTESGKQNFNLRHVTFKNKVPKSIFECICNSAPKLVELHTVNAWYYFVPINRLNLCSDISFAPFPANDEHLRLIEVIANTDGRLNLKVLSLYMANLQESPEVWPRVVSIANKLFEKCKHSLESIWLGRMSFLPGIKFPQMNKVKTLDLAGEGEYNYFTKRDRISECFPNLQTIVVNSIDELLNPVEFPLGSSDKFLMSVKSIRSEETDEVDEYELSLLRRWFPNAIVSNYDQFIH